jgi:bifunctional UDP-N-acetylglucosamine pyrophosphorylase/glucosamine-1-phosphate N-acetyltransferase
MDLTAVILAAGKGKRMVSDLPKVLHPLGGRPLLSHVLETVEGLGTSEIRVVYGHGGEMVRTACSPGPDVIWVRQGEQLGTGHAVAQTLSTVADDGVVLVLYGDVPLVRRDTLRALVDSAGKGCLALLTVELPDPTGYGRVIRNAEGRVQQVVEEADATPEQARVREVNTGILAAPVRCLKRWVHALENDNAQGEYYLTDVIEMAAMTGSESRLSQSLTPGKCRG